MRKENILRGDSLIFTNGFEIRQPTVSDIMDLGFEEYSWFKNCICSNISDMIVPLWGMGYDFEKIEEEDLLKILVGQNKTIFCEIFKYFTNAEKIYFIIDNNKEKLVGQINNKHFHIDEKILFLIKDFFCKINKIKHSRMRKFIGEKTKKSILDEDYEEYLFELKENKEKNEDYFGNLLSDLVIINKRDWNFVYSLYLSQLYEEIYKTSKKSKIDLTLQGIYCGNIDGSKIPSSSLDLNN